MVGAAAEAAEAEARERCGGSRRRRSAAEASVARVAQVASCCERQRSSAAAAAAAEESAALSQQPFAWQSGREGGVLLQRQLQTPNSTLTFQIGRGGCEPPSHALEKNLLLSAEVLPNSPMP